MGGRAFQSVSRGSILGGVVNFNIDPGTGCAPCLFSVLGVVSGGGPNILLTINSGRPVLVLMSSVLDYSIWLPLQASDRASTDL